MTTAPALLDSLATRAGQLYTLPRVAVEVLELTSQPQVDVRRLRQVIETDPALTAKLLRVVNSSLYGLSRAVSDLNQALAVLGTKPLKLLVLGFSLPDVLLAGQAGDLLERFWQHTLTRAVAAREISQTYCQEAGDEPFIAGLLRDLGQLVLVRELGASYVDFWRSAADRGESLTALERHSLGFDHTQLTARLLEQWKMPSVLVEAVAAPDSPSARGPLPARSRELQHILHLAELSARLLAGRRLEVLPDLVEGAREWLHLDFGELKTLLAALQEKVAQLAEVMSVKSADINYEQVLRQAQERMSEVAVAAVDELVRWSLEPSAEALESPAVWALSQTAAEYARWQVSAEAAETADTKTGHQQSRPGPSTPKGCGPTMGEGAKPAPSPVERGKAKTTGTAAAAKSAAKPPQSAGQSSSSAREAVVGEKPPSGATKSALKSISPRRKPDRPAAKPELPVPPPRDEWPGLQGLVATAAAACRTARLPLSLLCLEVSGQAELLFALGESRSEEVLHAVQQLCAGTEHAGARWLRTHEARFAIVLPNCTKQRAVQIGDELIAALPTTIIHLAGVAGATVALSAGAATISLPPKNFPAGELIERAGSCLYAAQAAGGDCLKSIEIL
jgi:HD-like signal output (HDOD) protein/GGDEF domain-containing protein